MVLPRAARRRCGDRKHRLPRHRRPPVWFTTNSASSSWQVSGLSLTQPNGTLLTNWGLIAADGESTDSGETLSWTVAGTGTSINVLENVNSPGGIAACTGGLSTTTTTVTCTGNQKNPGALLVQAPYKSGMSMTMATSSSASGQQGFMFGIFLPTVTFKKVATGLVDPTDAFTISATPTGGTPVSASTAPYTGGTWTGTASTGSSMGFLGGEVRLNEAMAAGSASPLTAYTQSWTCTNSYTGADAAPVPASGTTLPIVLTPKAGQDNIVCTLTNTAPSAGVSITKSSSPATFSAAGQTITYSFVVPNTGGQKLSNVAVTDPLSGLSAVSCPATTLAPAAKMTCTATYTTKASDVASGQVVNQASVRSTGGTGQNVNATSTQVSTQYVAQADLVAGKVLKTAAPLIPGQPVSWDLTILNNGPSTATNPTIADTFDAGVTGITWGTLPAGWACSLAAQNLNCNGATLASGASATITVTGNLAPSFTGALANTSTVTSSTADPGPGANTATTSTATAPRADVGIVKSAGSPNPVTAGQDVNWTLTATNAGPSNASAATVSDTVPSSVTAVSATTTAAGWTCSVSGQTVTCTNPSMPPGATATINVKGRVSSAQASSISNTATISTTATDPVSTNNSSTSSTNVVSSADLLSVKTLSTTSPATPGGTVGWLVRVTNTGPSDANSVSMTDTVPAAVTGLAVNAPAGWTCSLSGQTVTCTRASMAAGTSADITITGTLDPAFTGNLTNQASASTTTPDLTTANNTSTATTPTSPSTNLSVAKSRRSGGTPGQPVEWNVVVTNNGPSVATSVSMNDTLPDSVSAVTASGPSGWNCSVSQQNVSCLGATLAPNTSVTLVVGGVVNQFATGSVDNTATVSAATADPVPANNTASSSIPLTPTVDVSVVKAKTDPTASATAGSPVSWTLTVANAGPSGATGLTVTDAVPATVGSVSATVAGTGWSCTVSGQTVTCPGASLPSGGSVVITVSGRLAADATGNLAHTATVSSGTGITDSNTANNTSTVTVPIVGSADLTISKTRSTPDPAVPGRPLSWTVVVTNQGPSDAVSPSMSDTVNGAVTGVSATTSAPGWTCSVGAGNAVTCGAATLPAGASATITIAGTLGQSFTGALANSATVTSGTSDAVPGNNTATSTTSTAPDADLNLVKELTSASPAIPGTSMSWSLTLTNQGPSTAVNPRIADTVPSSITSPTATLSAAATAAGWTCSVTGSNLACQNATMAPGAVAVVTVSGVLAAATTGNVINTGAASSSTADSDASDNSSTVTTPTAPTGDVQVAKVLASAVPLRPGGAVAWDVTVRNAGPSTATSVVLTDTVPGSVTGVALGTAPVGWNCSATGQVVSCTTAALAPGASATIRINGVLDPAFTGDLSNTAAVTTATTDSDPSNNSATAVTGSSPSADLSLHKSAPSPSPVVPGQAVSWTLTIANAGPSTAVNPSVSDPLPTGVTGITTPTVPAGWTCSVTGQNLSCSAPSMAPGATGTISVRGVVSDGYTGSITNSASITSTTPDPDTGNNTESVTTPTAPRADLAMTKVYAGGSPPVPGQPVSWTVTLTNNGPSAAANPLITDTPPAVVSNPTGTVTAPGWSCSTVSGQVRCTAPSLAAGASVSLTVSGVLAASFTGLLSNTATVSSPTTDPIPGNNSATASATATPSADLRATKVLTTSAVPGTDVTWRIEVSNAGPSTAQAPSVNDTVPSTVSGVSAQPDAASAAAGWSCSAGTGNAVSCSGSSLAPGAVATVLVTGSLASTATGDLTNSATVSSATPDPTSSNNTGSATDPMTPRADVRITKKATPNTFVAGSTVSYEVTVENVGPSLAAGIVGTDTVPDGITITEVTTSSTAVTCTVAGQLVDCRAAALPVGGTGVLTVKGILAPGATCTCAGMVQLGTSADGGELKPLSTGVPIEAGASGEVGTTTIVRLSGLTDTTVAGATVTMTGYFGTAAWPTSRQPSPASDTTRHRAPEGAVPVRVASVPRMPCAGSTGGSRRARGHHAGACPARRRHSPRPPAR